MSKQEMPETTSAFYLTRGRADSCMSLAAQGEAVMKRPALYGRALSIHGIEPRFSALCRFRAMTNRRGSRHRRCCGILRLRRQSYDLARSNCGSAPSSCGLARNKILARAPNRKAAMTGNWNEARSSSGSEPRRSARYSGWSRCVPRSDWSKSATAARKSGHCSGSNKCGTARRRSDCCSSTPACCC
jgi:hypothetical protein